MPIIFRHFDGTQHSIFEANTVVQHKPAFKLFACKLTLSKVQYFFNWCFKSKPLFQLDSWGLTYKYSTGLYMRGILGELETYNDIQSS